MKSLTFITTNPTKSSRLSEYLNFEVGHKELDIPEIQSLDLDEVATEKAKAAYAILGTPVLVEDNSLTFDALNGLPGTFIKWFLRSIKDEDLPKLLDGYDDRSATAKVCYALCDETGVYLFRNSLRGTIAHVPKGNNGYGWNLIFIPEGASITYAEMDAEEQSKYSMRKPAVEKLQVHLEANYN
jgi:non-canonical purine NTP pyrophosphatase (RdgB/HAM1 family)